MSETSHDPIHSHYPLLIPSYASSFTYANQSYQTNHHVFLQVSGVEAAAIVSATFTICGRSNIKLKGNRSWLMILFA